MKFRFDATEEKKRLLLEADSKETARQISTIYWTITDNYTHGSGFSFLPNEGHPEYNERLEMIKKLALICIDLGVTPEAYINGQYESLLPYLRGQGMDHIPFRAMLTEKAIHRFKKHQGRIDDRHKSLRAARKALLTTATVDFEKAIRVAVDMIEKRLRDISSLDDQGITEGVAKFEVELLARARMISDIYLFSSNLFLLVEPSEIIKTAVRKIERLLTDTQKKMVKRIHTEVVADRQFQEFL